MRIRGSSQRIIESALHVTGSFTCDDLTALRTALGLPTNMPRYAQSVASQSGFATDTVLTGSSIDIPSNSLQIGSRYYLVANFVKTGAGTATPIVNVRFGTNGNAADSSRSVLTFSAQTGVVDEAVLELWCTFRVVGAAAVLQTLGRLTHRLAATGFSTANAEPEIATSGAFDSTVANSKITVTVNGGASASWTTNLVQARLENLV